MEVQAEVEHRFADDEQHENADIAAERHRYESAKKDGNVKDDDSGIRLRHEDCHDGSAILAAAEVVHKERPEVARRQREDAPPHPFLGKHFGDIGEWSE